MTDESGYPVNFTGNYDKESVVQQTLPYPVLTKRIRVKITSFHGKYPSIRLEMVGCKAGCVNSLGVCQGRGGLVNFKSLSCLNNINLILFAVYLLASRLPTSEFVLTFYKLPECTINDNDTS